METTREKLRSDFNQYGGDGCVKGMQETCTPEQTEEFMSGFMTEYYELRARAEREDPGGEKNHPPPFELAKK